MDFEATLTALLGMVGSEVDVSVRARADNGPPATAQMHGKLCGGRELRAGSTPALPAEAFYFYLAEDEGLGFWIHADHF